MFKFNDIKKLFTYNWGNVFQNLIPKSNNIVMEKDEYKNLNNGSILRIISVILSEIAIIGIAVYTIVKAYSWIYGKEILNYAIKISLTNNIGRYIVEIIIASIVPIAILVYNNVMKNKNQNGWPIFVILCLTGLHILYSIYAIVTYFIAFIVNPLFAILGIISIVLAFLANVHIIVGCIDFLNRGVTLYKKNNMRQSQPINQSQTPVQENFTNVVNNNAQIQTPQNSDLSLNQSAINGNIGQISQDIKNTKYCQNCGNKIASTALFCPNCGNKI